LRRKHPGRIAVQKHRGHYERKVKRSEGEGKNKARRPRLKLMRVNPEG